MDGMSRWSDAQPNLDGQQIHSLRERISLSHDERPGDLARLRRRSIARLPFTGQRISFGDAGFTLSFCANSGVDGRKIWEVEKPGIEAAPATSCWGPDVTDDGVADIAILSQLRLSPSAYASGLVALLSGADGSLVWERTFVELAPMLHLPGHRAEYLQGLVGFSRHFHGRGPADLLLTVTFEDLHSTTGIGQAHTVMLDARTGGVATVAEETLTAEPWYPDAYGILPIDYIQVRPVLGDVDRDGFNEVAARVELWSIDDPNIPGFPIATLILGRETLSLPAEASPGEQVKARLHIPSAPDHDFLLLLSLGFDRDGGKKVDGWRTFLAPDALLASTLAGRYPGRLDADGRGALQFQLPNHASLIGNTLYAKAVVFEPGSTTEVWTLSSLGILPIR